MAESALARRLVPYGIAWLLAGGLLVALLAGATPMAPAAAIALGLPMALLLLQLGLSARWVCRAFPLAPGLARLGRSVFALLLAGSLTCAAWLGLGRLWAAALEALSGAFAGLAASYAQAVPLLLAAGLPIYLLAAAGHYLVESLAESRRAERQALEARLLAREAELRALRAQVDPHFLFNSLNAVAALAGSDPAAARRTALMLAAFLRRSLRLADRDTVPLADELEAARSYLAIERVRFGDRLRLDEAIEPGVEALPVPPLILQPLVENAVKHGIAQRLDGGTVRLEAARRGGDLLLAVVNDLDDEAGGAGASRAAHRDGHGIGLANVRRRLDAAYGHRARLAAAPGPDGFRAELVLPAGAPPAAERSAR